MQRAAKATDLMPGAIIWVVLFVFLLSGCGIVARNERADQMTAAKAAMDSGFARCETEYASSGKKDHVSKTKCDFAAALSIRPYVPYPDLFDQEWATRAVIAERLQAGKMTPSEANQEATTMHAQISAEEQRRSLSGRAISAQEASAAAAWRTSAPVICNRIGTSTICN